VARHHGHGGQDAFGAKPATADLERNHFTALAFEMDGLAKNRIGVTGHLRFAAERKRGARKFRSRAKRITRRSSLPLSHTPAPGKSVA
jgi:hypothetical protein